MCLIYLECWPCLEFERKVDSFCKLMGFNKNVQRIVSNLKYSFVETARSTDRKVTNDFYLVISKGKLTLKKRRTQKTAACKAVNGTDNLTISSSMIFLKMPIIMLLQLSKTQTRAVVVFDSVLQIVDDDPD